MSAPILVLLKYASKFGLVESEWEQSAETLTVSATGIDLVPSDLV
jgi:hypothetical protein